MRAREPVTRPARPLVRCPCGATGAWLTQSRRPPTLLSACCRGEGWKESPSLWLAPPSASALVLPGDLQCGVFPSWPPASRDALTDARFLLAQHCARGGAQLHGSGPAEPAAPEGFLEAVSGRVRAEQPGAVGGPCLRHRAFGHRGNGLSWLPQKPHTRVGRQVQGGPRDRTRHSGARPLQDPEQWERGPSSRLVRRGHTAVCSQAFVHH